MQLPEAPYHFSDDLARPDRCPLIFAITQVGRLRVWCSTLIDGGHGGGVYKERRKKLHIIYI